MCSAQVNDREYRVTWRVQLLRPLPATYRAPLLRPLLPEVGAEDLDSRSWLLRIHLAEVGVKSVYDAVRRVVVVVINSGVVTVRPPILAEPQPSSLTNLRTSG